MDKKTLEYRNMIADMYRKEIEVMRAMPKTMPKNLFGQQLKVKSIKLEKYGPPDIQWEVDHAES